MNEERKSGSGGDDYGERNAFEPVKKTICQIEFKSIEMELRSFIRQRYNYLYW